MKTYILALSALEVVRLLKAEIKMANGQPELNMSCEKDYVIEEEFDRVAYGISNGEDFDLVASVATLSVEPRVESGYWVMQVVVERVIGPVRTSEENEMSPGELTLKEFEDELHSAGQKRVRVRLLAQTAAVKKDFEHWLLEMRTKHAGSVQHLHETGRVKRNITNTLPAGMSEPDIPINRYRIREAVGVFYDPDILESAVKQLEISGFDRSAISVLATDKHAQDQIACLYRTIREVENSDSTPRKACASRDSRIEGETVAVDLPLYIGGLAGAASVAAVGGALAFSVATAILGGAVGASLGAILAGTIAQRNAANVQEQLRQGGLILWVATPNAGAERRAMDILSKLGAHDAHIHEFQHEWSIQDLPLANVQPDPFLEKGGQDSRR